MGENAGRRGGRPMKLTGFYKATQYAYRVISDFQGLGAGRLADARPEHFIAARAQWKKISPDTASSLITAAKHLFLHSPFLTADRLTMCPWIGRSSNQLAGRKIDREENATRRIPEYISGPLLQAAVFYVETASRDILAARAEVAAYKRAAKERPRCTEADVTRRLNQYIDELRDSASPLPSVPLKDRHTCPDATVVDNIVQAPNDRLISLLADVRTTRQHRDLLHDAARELGYGTGGLRTPMSPWPGSGQPWRTSLGPREIREEISFLRVACWIIIAFLSGMRDAEVRELSPKCTFTEKIEGNRLRYKISGYVYKGRKLTGDEAEWVVLKIVHDAIGVLLELNDDPTHLFGYYSGSADGQDGYVLTSMVNGRVNRFRDHANELFSTDEGLFIPNELVTSETEAESEEDPEDEGEPWHFDARQFRRTLAWHIAHQPFGIVAGTRQFHHAKTTMFEGYAGTSASGFAAEVATEEAIAKLDYVEDLYRDWNDGHGATGGAAKRIDAEFERIRRELGDLPGVVASSSRLRTMLRHLVKTVHPGVLNDCFYQAATAVCGKRAQSVGRPLPQLNMCLSCPNARRSTVHLPRLTLARDQALSEKDATQNGRDGLPRLQLTALTEYSQQLDGLINEIHRPAEDNQPA
ncbi:hypothetical protein ABT404_13005 [Streptomyces hyaluromycini]|uniref:Integrase n=1 Tax=Streptomyces hyaluromycini TaxID=1377993 RepID=A0ABV1WUF0_9ACTN